MNTITSFPFSSKIAVIAKTTFPSSKTFPTSSKIAQVFRSDPSPACFHRAISLRALLSESSIPLNTFVIPRSRSTHPNPMSFMNFWDTCRFSLIQRSLNSPRKSALHPLALQMTLSKDSQLASGSRLSTECVVKMENSKVIATFFCS